MDVGAFFYLESLHHALRSTAYGYGCTAVGRHVTVYIGSAKTERFRILSLTRSRLAFQKGHKTFHGQVHGTVRLETVLAPMLGYPPLNHPVTAVGGRASYAFLGE